MKVEAERQNFDKELKRINSILNVLSPILPSLDTQSLFQMESKLGQIANSAEYYPIYEAIVAIRADSVPEYEASDKADKFIEFG